MINKLVIVIYEGAPSTFPLRGKDIKNGRHRVTLNRESVPSSFGALRAQPQKSSGGWMEEMGEELPQWSEAERLRVAERLPERTGDRMRAWRL